jgi:hypothetical protein
MSAADPRLQIAPTVGVISRGTGRPAARRAELKEKTRRNNHADSDGRVTAAMAGT